MQHIRRGTFAGEVNLLVWYDLLDPQIYTRDPRPPLPLCVMASSAMGLNLGVFVFLPTMHAKTDAKPMHPQSSCAMRRFMHVLSQTAVDAVTYARDEPWLF